MIINGDANPQAAGGVLTPHTCTSPHDTSVNQSFDLSCGACITKRSQNFSGVVSGNEMLGGIFNLGFRIRI